MFKMVGESDGLSGLAVYAHLIFAMPQSLEHLVDVGRTGRRLRHFI